MTINEHNGPHVEIDVEVPSNNAEGQQVMTTPVRKITSQKLSSFQKMPISPADTFDTINTQESPTATNHSVVTVRHKHKSSSGGGMRSLRSPLKLGLGLFLLLSTGGFAYFFSKWFEIPGLTKQIDRLEAEVNRLSIEVILLSQELDRYETLNRQLNNTIVDLDRQNGILNASNVRLELLVNYFNESVTELGIQNELLAEEVGIYTGLNQVLNATVHQLSRQVVRLETAAENLSQENDNLTNQVDRLEQSIQDFSDENVQLSFLIEDLGSQVSGLLYETNRLERLSTDLGNIVSFLDETADRLDETYEIVSRFLSEQITAYRSIVLETLQNIYSQRIANWDCAYRDVFRLEDFVANGGGNVPIGDAYYPAVLDYVDGRVLSELCLSTQDFERFLDSHFGPDIPTTTNHLISSIQRYTMAAMDYYFPDDGEQGGLTQADWAMAYYDCESLPDDHRFSMYPLETDNTTTILT
jgi:predicted  nucleic acid-binding Zn-ribbon protein